ncbi:MAG TPA: hypothetical protein VI423_02030 [Paenisporosarcina sp.]|nr:hypothetical protein [Paenisporosarcina sp.]
MVDQLLKDYGFLIFLWFIVNAIGNIVDICQFSWIVKKFFAYRRQKLKEELRDELMRDGVMKK